MTTRIKQDGISEAEIFASILELRFSERENRRMHQLAAKNQEGRLSPAEAEELDNYVKVGDLLAILQSKARKHLKQKNKRHG